MLFTPATLLAALSLAGPILAFQQEAATTTCTPGAACSYTYTYTDPTTNVAQTVTASGNCAPNGYCLDNGAACSTSDQCYNYCPDAGGVCGGAGALCDTTDASSHASQNTPCNTPSTVCGANGSTSTCALAASGANGSRRKRDTLQFAVAACDGKENMVACPVNGGAFPRGKLTSSAWECVNTMESLEQCGGCNEHSGGVDCSAIPNVAQVGCSEGKCVIESCEAGYLLSNGKCL